jgi:triosephosphate isomerase (TIM)
VLIAGNWKMYKGPEETARFCRELRDQLEWVDGVDVAVCPSFPSLSAAVQSLAGTDVAVAAQNVHWEVEGPFTGEVSAPMLFELGVYGAIVGHSERRQLFGETDEMVARKARAVFGAEMIPIVCVGESLEDRDAGRTDEKVVGQVRAAVSNLPPEQTATLVVAYEPIWAIGTGRTASPEDAGQVIRLIRETVGSMAGPEAAAAVRIQYGGSVKAANIRDFMAHPEIDGALVGGASLDPEEFALIVKYPS